MTVKILSVPYNGTAYTVVLAKRNFTSIASFIMALNTACVSKVSNVHIEGKC